MRSIGENTMVGNKTLLERLYSDIKAGTLGHAYIIEGKRGSGRHTLAKIIIASLACESGGASLPCGECKNCRNILENKCPDVFTVGRDGKASVGIAAARDIKSTIMAVANDLEFKAYVIEDADTMTPQAQNALLLTLEQPPTRCYFFILCENARTMLETIRSRAPVIRTEALSTKEIDDHISSFKVPSEVRESARALKQSDPNEYDTVLLAAGGSIGRAIELLHPETREPITLLRNFAIRFIDSARSCSADEPLVMLLPEFAGKKDGVLDQLDYVKNALRDLILLKKSENAPLCFFFDREDAIERSSAFAERRLIRILDEVSKAEEALLANANLRLTLLELLTRI